MANERTPLLKSGETEPIPSEVVIAPGKSAPEEKSPVVSVNDLFHFHDGTDVFLMILGTLGAILYGALTPAQYIVMGKLTDDFVEFAQCIKDNCTPVPDLEDSMTKVAGWYVGIAFANLLFAWMALGLWGLTAERQVHRMRLALFRNIINQEIGWFDTHPSGELNTRLTEDLNKTADGMGSKFGRFVSCFFTFLCGYAIGFGYCWQMTLVMMTMLPMVMISGGIIAQITGGFTEKELSAYAKAGNVAEQSISSIRTVAAFGGEEKQGEKYEEHLDEACGFGIKKGFSIGLGMCVFQLVLFGNYALSFWYGIKLVRDRDAEPGDIITILDIPKKVVKCLTSCRPAVSWKVTYLIFATIAFH